MARWNRIIGSSEEAENAFSDALALFNILLMLLAISFLVKIWYVILLVTLYILIIISNVAVYFYTMHVADGAAFTRRIHQGLENSRILSDEQQSIADEQQSIIVEQQRIIEGMNLANSGQKDIQEEVDMPTIRKIRVGRK